MLEALSGSVQASALDLSQNGIATLVFQDKHRRLYHVSTLMVGRLGDLWEWIVLNHQQILLYAALTDLKTNIQIGVDSSAYIWVRAVQFHGITHTHHAKDGKPIPFHKDGSFYKDKPIITALFSYAEVMEAFAQQDPTVYPQESVENFLFPLDRYSDAYTAPDICPVNDQVLALRKKVQTAQQFGMIILPSGNGLVITSGVPVRSIVGAVDNKGRHLDVQTLKSLEWKVADAPREQPPCTRGKCYLPSLEICHAYRLLTEHADGSPNITSLPAFDPSKHKDLRAPRSPDATGVHLDMMHCEFKGCAIMVYGKIARPPIGTNQFPGWDPVSRPARSYMGKGKGSGKYPGKGKAKGQGKGKGKGDRDDTLSREDRTKSDPKGPNVVPPTWKDKEYDDIPIVQDARPADHYVEAYLQGTSDIPTFRVVWITSMGTMPRSKLVSPNRFGDSKLWKTPDEEPEFWEPCKHDQGYATLSPGEDDCCRMCPNTDAEELIPCAWCNSWAHYRCTYAVGPGRACASHFKVLNPLDKIVVARDDDLLVPHAQKGRQVFPNCCHPRVAETGKPTPSNVQYTNEAYWVYKHAWRGVGAYYQKGDHIQKKKTGNVPVEFKALRMFPDWERWITPRPTFLSDQLLKEAATLEEKGEAKSRVRRHNVFEHYQEGFQPHTLPNPPMVIQCFKEYKERSNLDPNKGNLWGCFWDACSVKEKGFWMAALEHNKTYSLVDDCKVYHPIKFGEAYPGYRPKGDEMPNDRPTDNDQRFCYYTNVRLWKTSQVPEERTHRVASDKVRLWLDAAQSTNPGIQVDFPPSQVEANQKIAAAKSSGKRARKRQSSVPPESDTAKAKQARAKAEEKGKKAGKGKGRIPSIPKHELATTAAALAAKVNEVYPKLRAKDKRTIQSLAHDWYKAIYHTKFHMTKPEYMDHLCNTAIGVQNAKEPDPAFKAVMIKALTSLKGFVNDPTTAGLPDPNQAPPIEPIGQKRPATTTASQVNPKVAKAKAGMGTYAEAAIGKSKSPTPPIGAKSTPAKASAKAASGAIGAPVSPKGKAKSMAKDQGGNPPIGAASTAKQDAAKRNNPSITSETALEFLRDAPATHSQNINRLHKAHLRDMKPKMHRMCKMVKLLKMSKLQERIKLTWMHKAHRIRMQLSQLKLLTYLSWVKTKMRICSRHYCCPDSRLSHKVLTHRRHHPLGLHSPLTKNCNMSCKLGWTTKRKFKPCR